MTDRTLIAALKRIQADAALAISILEGTEADQVGICPWCGKPILEGQSTVRGVHQSTCYSFAQSRVSAGETTWEQLESDGLVKPPAKRGRKKLSQEEHRKYGQSIAASAKKKSRKK